MVQLGSIFGALFAFPITDRIGRLWAVRELCLVWVTGIAIFLGAAAHGSLGMVYAGRFIAGLGIGQTTVVAPTYLAEVAPKSIRGLCVGIFSGSVYLGIMLGYFASYGTSLHISNHNVLQWVIPNTLHLYFAAIIFTLSFFAIESPRWLIKRKQQGKAVENLCKIRGLGPDHELVQSEVIDINSQLEREQEATMGASKVGLLRELFVMPSNRYRIFLAIFAQLLGQWSGAGSITVYAPQYFALMGTTGTQEKLLATGIFGLVKFISALLCAFFLVDFIGRKRSLSIGITIQFIAMLYMALFLTIDNTIGDKGNVQTASQKSAAKGAIAMIYFSGFGWAMGKSLIYINVRPLLIVSVRLELNPIPYQRRDLPPASPCYWWIYCHGLPLCQPIRQLQGRTRDVCWHDHCWYHVLLRCHYPFGSWLGLLLPARDQWSFFGELGCCLRASLVQDRKVWKQGCCVAYLHRQRGWCWREGPKGGVSGVVSPRCLIYEYLRHILAAKTIELRFSFHTPLLWCFLFSTSRPCRHEILANQLIRTRFSVVPAWHRLSSSVLSNRVWFYGFLWSTRGQD